MLAVVVKRRDGRTANEDDGQGDKAPSQASSGLFGQRAPANRDTLLSPQEGRFLFHVQIEQSLVIGCVVVHPVRGLVGRWIQLLLHDGGTAFSRHQSRPVVVRESLSGNNYNCFSRIEVDASWSLLHKNMT